MPTPKTTDDPEWGEPTWKCQQCDAMGFLPSLPTKCMEVGCPMKSENYRSQTARGYVDPPELKHMSGQFILGYRQGRDDAVNAQNRVCQVILSIMDTYHQQEASDRGVDTPGGLEHMGDVWGLFLEWEAVLKGIKDER